jgi:hypothetical protein
VLGWLMEMAPWGAPALGAERTICMEVRGRGGGVIDAHEPRAHRTSVPMFAAAAYTTFTRLHYTHLGCTGRLHCAGEGRQDDTGRGKGGQGHRWARPNGGPRPPRFQDSVCG